MEHATPCKYHNFIFNLSVSGRSTLQIHRDGYNNNDNCQIMSSGQADVTWPLTAGAHVLATRLQRANALSNHH